MSDDFNQSLGVGYLRDTSFDRSSIQQQRRLRCEPAEPFKYYPGVPRLTLPRTSWNLKESRMIPLLQQRRSLRKFSAKPPSLSELAFLLWSSQGITAQAGSHFLRTAPSAGALYPIETYVAINSVEGVDAGLYHLDIRSFQLELIAAGSHAEKVAAAFLDQQFMTGAAITLIWTAVLRRNLHKYGDRGVRYLLLDAAHICQNLLLAAEAIGCGGCPVAAFYDDELSGLLALDQEQEVPIYGASIGKK